MSAATITTTAPPSRRTTTVRAFLGVLGRDVAVTGREFGSFLSQVLVQPFFLLFVFGKVLSQLGYIAPGYAQLLLPGLLALNAFLVAVQAVALPLVIDFSYTKEIEDRLLAPLSTRMVAVEKIVFGALRGMIGSLVMIPVGYLVLDQVTWNLPGLPESAVLLVLGALAGGAAGLVIGTIVSPRRINIVFAVVITPLLFTGSTQFPFLQNLLAAVVPGDLRPEPDHLRLRGAARGTDPADPPPPGVGVLRGAGGGVRGVRGDRHPGLRAASPGLTHAPQGILRTSRRLYPVRGVERGVVVTLGGGETS